MAGAATLEVTLIGPELQFDDERVIGVAGAEFDLTVNGRAVAANTAFAVSAGSRLRFGRRLRGTRAYVAVGGGIGVAPVLGSRATHLASRMGGLDGRSLEAGDRLPLGDPGPQRAPSLSPARPAWLSRRADVRVVPDGHARVRVLPGPQRRLLRGRSAPRPSGGARIRSVSTPTGWASGSRVHR